MKKKKHKIRNKKKKITARRKHRQARRRRRPFFRRRTSSIFKAPPLKPVFKEVVAISDKESPGKKKRTKELTELIALGKEKGHLTFEEVNNILPVDIVSSEEID